MSHVRRPGWRLAATVVSVSVVLLATQADLTGFDGGHRGWIASQTLANAAHTTPANLFAGYSLAVADGQGRQPLPVYFNRAPFVGFVIIGVPLWTSARLATQVRLSRLLSNLIVCLALALMLHVLVSAGVPLPLATAAVCIAGSGHWLMRYRDVPSVDVGSLLGFSMVAWAAQLAAVGKRRAALWLVGVAASIGWGYSVLAPLCIWTAVDVFAAWRKTRKNGLRAMWSQARGTPGAAAQVLAVALTVGYLAHATLGEAALRQVSVAQTELVHSARKRLGFDPDFNDTHKAARADVANVLGKRLVRGALPESVHASLGPTGRSMFDKPAWLSILIGLFVLAAWAIWRRPPRQRLPTSLLAFGGVGWFLGMPNLSLHHDYVAIAAVGLVAVAASGVLAELRPLPHALQWLAAGAALALLLHTSLLYNADKQLAAQRFNPITDEFERIADALPAGVPVHYREGFRGLTGQAPYKVGFYLPDHAVASQEADARFAITRHREGPGTLLTGANQRVFLYQTTAD